MFIPNNCIVSIQRARNSGIKHVLEAHPELFESKHPDCDQLTLTAFLIHEALKGEQSFFKPYLDVMNEADLVCFWSKELLDQLHDIELFLEAGVYSREVYDEWSALGKCLKQHPDAFPGYEDHHFARYYNLACTRCFGWTLPSTMMVPMADFLNHQPSDTQYEIYEKKTALRRASVDANHVEPTKLMKKIDWSPLYQEEELTDFSAEQLEEVKGKREVVDSIVIPREQLERETADKVQKTEVWDTGYWSTDQDENNDSSNEEYADSEEESDYGEEGDYGSEEETEEEKTAKTASELIADEK